MIVIATTDKKQDVYCSCRAGLSSEKSGKGESISTYTASELTCSFLQELYRLTVSMMVRPGFLMNNVQYKFHTLAN